MPPVCLYTPICLYVPIHSYAPWDANTPICPPYSSMHLYVLGGICMLLGVVGGPLHVGHLPYMLDTSPIWGMPPHMSYTPTHWLAYLCICMFRWCLHVIWGIFPLLLGVWGAFPHILGVYGASSTCQALVSGSTSIGCPLCFILYLFVVHYVSHIYHGYNYYYFQLWWCLLVCHLFHQWPWPLPWWGFLQHWVSVKWFCHHPWCWDALEVLLALPPCHSSNLHLLMPLLAYANYAMGSPQVRFLFQSWASHHFIYYMFGVHSGVCFLLSGAKLDAIFPYGGLNH